MDVDFWWTMATKTPFAIWLAALIVFSTQKGGNYGRRQGSKLVYSSPWQFVLFGLVMTASSIWMGFFLWNTPERWLIVPEVSLLALLFLWLFQPYTLQIDCKQKTYCLANGWPLIQRRRRGSLTDVEQFRIVYAKGDSVLVVVWKGRGPRTTRLGSYRGQAQAEAAATEVQAAWGIKVPVSAG